MPLAQLTSEGWIIVLTGVGVGLSGVGLWLGPIVSKALTVNPDLAAANKVLADRLEALQESYSVIASCFAGFLEEMPSERDVCLLVEDQAPHTKLIMGMIESTLARAGLRVVRVTSVQDACQHVRKCVVMILDVNLAGSPRIPRVNALIDSAPSNCRAIIHAAADYPPGTFPGAFRVLRKWDGDNELVKALEDALGLERVGHEDPAH